MKRAGLVELAAAAGVSVATVDRLLNDREGVNPDTAARIAEAAQRIGHPAAWRLAAIGKVNGSVPELRFGVVLHKQGQDFYKAFADELHHAVSGATGLRGKLVLEFSSSQSPTEMAQMLRSMAGRCDVLAATAVNHPEVTAVVEDLQRQGLAVFSLLSEFAQGIRTGYLGLNNLKHGRTSGWVMAQTAKGPGNVAVFVGGHRWHGHELREAGFRAYLREYAPHLVVLEPMVNLETRQLTYEATRNLLSRQSDLRGVYVAGGGMEGAIAALRESGQSRQICCVVSSLTAESRAGLAEGIVTMVIDTPLEKLCRALVTTMALAVRDRAKAEGTQLFLSPDLHLAESL